MEPTFERPGYPFFGVLLIAAALFGCDSTDDSKAKKAKSDAQSKAAPAPAPKADPVAPPPVAVAPQPAPPAPPPPVAVAPQPAPPSKAERQAERRADSQAERRADSQAERRADSQAERRADKWELLGERQADLKADRDRIQVGRSEGRFRELQLTVRGAPLEIYEMVVTFGNGQQFKPTVRLQFDERTSSRVIDLPGDRRVIKQVDFVYRTPTRREGKATISLYGR